MDFIVLVKIFSTEVSFWDMDEDLCTSTVAVGIQTNDGHNYIPLINDQGRGDVVSTSPIHPRAHLPPIYRLILPR